MKSKTITTMLVTVFATFILADAASAYYSPRMGRFLNRDPIDEPGATLVRQVARPVNNFIPRDAITSFANTNSYRYVHNSPSNLVDPDGLAPCERSIFPGVVLQRFTSSIGHEWIVFDGLRRGFYPKGDKSLPMIVAGHWIDEYTYPKLYVESPAGSGNYTRVDRIDWAISNDWYDEWNTRRRCTGKLKYGVGKGKGCECATREEMLACLLERTKPDSPGTYLLIGGNCRDHNDGALADCCLRRYQKTHSGRRYPSGGLSGS